MDSTQAYHLPADRPSTIPPPQGHNVSLHNHSIRYHFAILYHCIGKDLALCLRYSSNTHQIPSQTDNNDVLVEYFVSSPGRRR